jgi:hypothetical protein
LLAAGAYLLITEGSRDAREAKAIAFGKPLLESRILRLASLGLARWIPVVLLLEHDAGASDRGYSYLISVCLQSGVVFASGKSTLIVHDVSADGGPRLPMAETPASAGKSGQLY